MHLLVAVSCHFLCVHDTKLLRTHDKQGRLLQHAVVYDPKKISGKLVCGLNEVTFKSRAGHQLLQTVFERCLSL